VQVLNISYCLECVSWGLTEVTTDTTDHY